MIAVGLLGIVSLAPKERTVLISTTHRNLIVERRMNLKDDTCIDPRVTGLKHYSLRADDKNRKLEGEDTRRCFFVITES